MEWELIVQLFFYGLLAGVLGGLLGIGGGVIFVLVLPSTLAGVGVDSKEIVSFTVANSLFATVFTTLSGNLRQAKSNNFFLRPILAISIPGVVVSFFVIHYIVNSAVYSKELFDLFFLLVVLYLLIRFLWKINKVESDENPSEIGKENKLSFFLTGVGTGIVSPLTGLGGGLVIVPILHSLLNFPIKKANSISLGVIGITAFATSLVNMFEIPNSSVSVPRIGLIILPIVFSLSFGGIIGAFFGVELSKKIKSNWISMLFASFLVLVLLKKIFEMYYFKG